MAKLGINLLGPFQVLLNGVPVTAFESVKVRALLAYLAAEYSRPHSRDSLAVLLWPDWPQQSAMRNLRNALTDLRKVIGDQEAQPPFLLVSRDSLQLNRDANLLVDVLEFESTNHQSAIKNPQSAIALYRGPFLEGFSFPDSAPFEEWTLAKRAYFSQQVLKALSGLAALAIEHGQYEQAEGYARRQIELEPWREQAYQQLMRALSLKGQRVQALAQFENLKKALQRELQVEPSEDTLRLYQSIRDEEDQGTQGKRDKGTGVTTSPLSPTPYPLPHHNLPLQLTSFIGREKEIEAVTQLLQTNRLVTLTGMGGTGKTRLALRTASDLLDQYADGVWLAELAPLSDPALVPTLAGRALGLRELTGPQMVELLQDYLEPLQVLLIFDNCEHVIEACASLATTLLQTCPRLTILASSREALGIPGEVPFRVPPLSLPAPESIHTSPAIEELAQSEAIRLFVERATTISSSFSFTPANAPAILQICQRLDGIPLAIELAAARVRLLWVDEIVKRLDDRFRLLTGGSRAALERYQTLRASIDWSYELLSEAERTLLQRLSVFASGWVLEAAEAVGCGESIQSCDVLELLGQLVDKSLVQTISEVAGLSRYRMLETIRQYAHEKLVESGQAEVTCQRHLMYYLELAERVEWKIRGPDQPRILEQLEAELDNLRQALAWSQEGRGRLSWSPEPGLRLAAALQWFWDCSGHLEEGIRWLELLLQGELEERGERPIPLQRTRHRAKALQVAAYSARSMNEFTKATRFFEESRDLYLGLGPEGRLGYAYALLSKSDRKVDLNEVKRLDEESLAICREQGDQFGEGQCLINLGWAALVLREYERAKGYFEENMALQNEIGDREGIAGALVYLGLLAYYRGDYEQARSFVGDSMSIYSDNHNDVAIGTQHNTLRELDMLEGNYAQAAAHASVVLSIGRRRADGRLIHLGQTGLGEVSLIQGNYAEAAGWCEESLAYFRKKDHKLFVARSLFFLGLLAWATGKFEHASRIYTSALLNCREGDDQSLEVSILCGLGKVAFAMDEVDKAQIYIEQALGTSNLFWSVLLLHREPVAIALEAMAFLAAANGLVDPAVRILGATEAWHKRFYYSRIPREHQERETVISKLREEMDEDTFAAAWAEGQAMTQEQAILLAKGTINR